MEQNNRMSLDDVMRKIKKLQKLYEGAKKVNSEAEANNAAAKMQKLLTEYNLKLEDISFDDDTKAAPVTHEYVDGETQRTGGSRWENMLMGVLCKYNYCRCYQIGKGFKRMMIVGEPHNLEVVKWTREVLCRIFFELSEKRWKEYKKTAEYAMKPCAKMTYQRQYLIGCVSGLGAKLHEERKAAEKESTQGTKITALVVKKDAAVAEYVESRWKVGTSAGYCQKQTTSGFSKGFVDGRNTDINRAVSGNKTQLQLN